MGAFPFQIVGFDLDGTLVDTRADIAGALNHTLAHDGRATLPMEQVVPMVGGGVRHLVEQALAATGGGGDVDALLPVLMAYYAEHPLDHGAPYPGVIETLRALAARGVRLGIVTNKPQRITDLVLAKLGIADLFPIAIGGDAPDIAHGKPAPDAILAMIGRLGGGRAAFVGDSRYDLAAARAAGVPAIFCRFGFAADDGAAADAAIDRFDQLIPLLETL